MRCPRGSAHSAAKFILRSARSAQFRRRFGQSRNAPGACAPPLDGEEQEEPLRRCDPLPPSPRNLDHVPRLQHRILRPAQQPFRIDRRACASVKFSFHGTRGWRTMPRNQTAGSCADCCASRACCCPLRNASASRCFVLPAHPAAAKTTAARRIKSAFMSRSATRRHFLQHLDTMRNRSSHETEALDGAARLAGQANDKRLVDNGRKVSRQNRVFRDL